MRNPSTPYNPLDRRRLAESVADALLLEPAVPLGHIESLSGAGIYAIYYAGTFPLYKPLALEGADSPGSRPIYVGKAVPRGARKGGLTFDAAAGTPLRDRLRQHAASISEASNLSLRDFRYRALVVDDIWIPLGESMLIETFKPVWNVIVEGFGIKDPGARRATQHRSSWDALHPGRRFAQKLASGDPRLKELRRRIADHLAGAKVKTIPLEDAVDPGMAPDESEEG